MQVKLTDITIRQLPNPEKGHKMYWDTVVPGFGVRVTAKSKAYFIVYGTERRSKTLGKYPAMPLKTARDEAKRFQVTDTPKQQLQRLTDAREAYLRECDTKNAKKTVDQYRLYLEKVNKQSLSDVTRSDVDLNSPHAVMAWKVFFNWCIRNELTDSNPFAHTQAKWKSRNRVLTDGEIKKVWAYEFPPYSTYLKLLLLTGQRVNQFAQFQHSWIHDDLIHFPAEVMKGGRAHTLPVTPMVADLLDKHQPFNGWSKAKSRIDKFVTIPHWTNHDLRRTHSTIQAKLGTPLHVTEAILSHTSGQVSGIAAIYNQYDYLNESRTALVRLEDYVKQLVG